MTLGLFSFSLVGMFFINKSLFFLYKISQIAYSGSSFQTGCFILFCAALFSYYSMALPGVTNTAFGINHSNLLKHEMMLFISISGHHVHTWSIRALSPKYLRRFCACVCGDFQQFHCPLNPSTSSASSDLMRFVIIFVAQALILTTLCRNILPQQKLIGWHISQTLWAVQQGTVIK